MAATVNIIFAGKEFKFLKKDYLEKISHHLAILEPILSMSFTQARKSPSGSAYCYPRQEWLGNEVDCCRKTVNEAVGKYRDDNVIITQWREPRNGHFRTLLYFPGLLILKAMGCAMSAAQAVLLRVTSGLHISSTKTKDILQTCEKDETPIKFKDPPLADIILRMEKAHPELT